MTQETKDALLNWAHTITAEVQNLCEAAENQHGSNQVSDAVSRLQDTFETVSESEVITAQANRIRDLVSANVALLKACADVIRSVDQTGCTEDLAVVNNAALSKLHNAFASAGGSL